MSDKIKEAAPKILEEIQKAKKILLHLHPGPDPDSYGSALAMWHYLKSLGKDVTLIGGDSPPKLAMSQFPGYDQITRKNYFEIKPEEFDLFIVLDSAALNQISKKGNVTFPPEMTVIDIDHHASNSGYGQINLVDPESAATCQIVYDLLKEWKATITPEIAACLFTGIYSDTGGFKYLPTNWETLQAGSELAKIYPDYFRIIFQIENSKTPKQLEFLGLALGSIEHYFSDKVAIACVSYDAIQKHGISADDSRNAEVPNILKSVTGWTIGISFIERGPGVVELGFRKREYEGPDLSIVASALGGGGHKAAAGATINQPFDEAKKTLLEALKKAYPELGNP